MTDLIEKIKELLIDEENSCMGSALNVYLGRREFESVEALFRANNENIKLAKIGLKDYTEKMHRLHPALMNSLGSGTKKNKKNNLQ